MTKFVLGNFMLSTTVEQIDWEDITLFRYNGKAMSM